MLKIAKEWWQFLKDNPLFGLILLILLATLLYFAPFHPETCENYPYQNPENCVPRTVFSWVLAILDNHSGAVSAVATVFIAWFTLTLMKTSVVQGETTQKSLELAIKRPWIFINGIGQLDLSVENRQFFCVRYDVVNHGEAPAIIEAARQDFMLTEGEPWEPLNVDQNHRIMVSPIIGPTEKIQAIEAAIPLEFFGDSALSPVADIQMPEIPNGFDLYLWIKIFYRGTSTAGHETSGLWRLAVEQNTSTFVATGGEQYNYAK